MKMLSLPMQNRYGELDYYEVPAIVFLYVKELESKLRKEKAKNEQKLPESGGSYRPKPLG